LGKMGQLRHLDLSLSFSAFDKTWNINATAVPHHPLFRVEVVGQSGSSLQSDIPFIFEGTLETVKPSSAHYSLGKSSLIFSQQKYEGSNELQLHSAFFVSNEEKYYLEQVEYFVNPYQSPERRAKKVNPAAAEHIETIISRRKKIGVEKIEAGDGIQFSSSSLFIIFKESDMILNANEGCKNHNHTHQLKNIPQLTTYGLSSHFSNPSSFNDQIHFHHLSKRDDNPQDALIPLFVDCNLYRNLVDQKLTVVPEILKAVSRSSAVYKQDFDIQLLASRIVVNTQCGTESWNQECGMDIEKMLSLFDNWRQTQTQEFGTAAWELLTSCFEAVPGGPATTVGLANTKTLCSAHSSAVVSITSPDSWTVFAHETGHIFGAQHDEDCAGCNCGGKYIMAAVKTSDAISKFSSCTLNTVDNLLPNYHCLPQTGTEGQRTPAPHESPICGNGLWEDGEECDCGYSCSTDKFCDSTCKLREGFQCSDTNTKCCSNGKIITDTTTLCRSPNKFDSCDVPDYCDGTTAICRVKYAPDNSVCTASGAKGKCKSGVCKSRAVSCALIGPTLTPPRIFTDCQTPSDPCNLICYEQSSRSCTSFSPSEPVPDGLPCVDGNGNPTNYTCYQGRCNDNSSAISLSVSSFLISLIAITLLMFVF